jgi:hypothetical protein
MIDIYAHAPRAPRASSEEHGIVPGADILVGVPCYKDGPMVDRCLRSLEEPGVQLLLVDNGSDPDVKQAIEGKGVVIRNEVNRYVNPAWNQIMEVFLERSNYDLLVIANSDLVLDPGWAEKLRAHRAQHPHEQLIFGIDAPRQRRSIGTFFGMTRRAALASCPIPDDLLVLGGDDFIFRVNTGVGHAEHVVPSITMTHVERGTYDKAPEIWDLARRDTDRWNQYVREKLVPRRIKEFLAHATAQMFQGHIRALYEAHLRDCSTCKYNDDCAACGVGSDGGHACNCPGESGGYGYRLRDLWVIAQDATAQEVEQEAAREAERKIALEAERRKAERKAQRKAGRESAREEASPSKQDRYVGRPNRHQVRRIPIKQ